ncbi:LysR family transcriptional regulator [Burkholderia metallica]
MDIRKLRHALGLAQHLTFSRASVDVNLSQPALSRSIQSIEAGLGVTLFERSPGGVTLTPFGKVFVERARRIVLEASELQRDLSLMQLGEYGELSIGLGATPAIVLTNPLVDHFLLHAPQVNLRIKRGRRDALLRRLLDEDVEIFFGDVAQLEDRHELRLSPLPSWPSGFFCSPGHPLAERTRVAPGELLDYRIGSIELSAWATADLGDYFERPIAAAITFRSDDYRDIEAAAANGRMLVFGNRAVFRGALERGELREIPLDPPLRRSARLGSVTLAARTLSPAAERAKALAEAIFTACAAEAMQPLKSQRES